MGGAYRIRAIGILTSLLMAGCGSSVGTKPVNGSVKFSDGTPLKTGQVIFTSPTNTSKGVINEDGSFSLTTVKEGDGAPPGQYSVYILGATVRKDPKDPYSASEDLIDKKFTDPKTSGLSSTVEEKATTVNLVVAKPGG